MSKTLCDWSKKDISSDFDKLCKITSCPRYVCRKCARSANHSKFLCKPKKSAETLLAVATAGALKLR